MIKKNGFAQIPVILGLLLMAIAIPVATQLSQTTQENRSSAAGGCSKDLDCGTKAQCAYCMKNKQYPEGRCVTGCTVGLPTFGSANPTNKPGSGGSTSVPTKSPTTVPTPISNGTCTGQCITYTSSCFNAGLPNATGTCLNGNGICCGKSGTAGGLTSPTPLPSYNPTSPVGASCATLTCLSGQVKTPTSSGSSTCTCRYPAATPTKGPVPTSGGNCNNDVGYCVGTTYRNCSCANVTSCKWVNMENSSLCNGASPAVPTATNAACSVATSGTYKCSGVMSQYCSIEHGYPTVATTNCGTAGCNATTGLCNLTPAGTGCMFGVNGTLDPRGANGGERRCNQNTVYQCTANRWDFAEECKPGTICENGACVPSTLGCNVLQNPSMGNGQAGETKCAGNDLFQCTAGRWDKIKTCGPGFVCSSAAGGGAAGNDTCIPSNAGCFSGVNGTANPLGANGGERRCNQNTVYQCTAMRWDFIEECKPGFICDAGKCVASNLGCTVVFSSLGNGQPGETKCSGNDLFQCTANRWDKIKTCGPGHVCSSAAGDDTCIPSNAGCNILASTGIASNGQPGETKCVDNDLYQCTANRWDKINTCGLGEICSDGSCKQMYGTPVPTSTTKGTCTGNCLTYASSCFNVGLPVATGICLNGNGICCGNPNTGPLTSPTPLPTYNPNNPTPKTCTELTCLSGQNKINVTGTMCVCAYPGVTPGTNPSGVPTAAPTTPPSTPPGTGTNPTTVPTTKPGTGTNPTATGVASKCINCPNTFSCYKNATLNEAKWFATGMPMIGFSLVADSTCTAVKPMFLGKSKGDANCDGSITSADYSLWHKEFYDGDAGAIISSKWNADFTGPDGVCDGKVNTSDYSLWHKYFYELM